MALTQKIKKRNGEIADFEPEKIGLAVQKAFAAVMGDSNDAVAMDVMRAHGGAITVETEPGKESVFALVLPKRAQEG